MNVHLDDGLTAGVREEGTSKNPIRMRLRMDRDHADPDRLTGMVACGRDFFHSFISQTVRRRYRRPPIYLVDAWLIDALGVFMMRGGVKPPQADATRSGAEAAPQIEGFGEVLQLFEAVEAVEAHLKGAQLLVLEKIIGSLQENAIALLTDGTVLAKLQRQCKSVVDMVSRAMDVLETDFMIQPYANRRYVDELRQKIDTLLQAAAAVAQMKPVAIPALSFAPGRGSGVIFGSIKELDIEGPAILLAPRRIQGWAETKLGRHVRPQEIDPRWSAEWFGAKTHADVVFSFGLANVLQHEMTHAMLALPNDPVQELAEMHHQHWHFYETKPEFEEGLANFTGAVCSAMMLMKARFGIRGVDLPVLHTGKYGKVIAEYDRLLTASYEGYFDHATNVFFDAWHANNLDYGAFAGLVKMFATNFGGLNWDVTFKGLAKGQIGTGR